jgi:hypothetical protein
MELDFRNWLMQETGTFTNSIAVFARPMMPGMVRRGNLQPWQEEGYDKEEKKKLLGPDKKKKKK